MVERSVNVREVLNGIFDILSTGCQWQALARDLPPKSTVQTILSCGTGTAHWNVSIMRSMWRCVSRKGVKQVPRWRSSTADCERRAKSGAWLDRAGYDAGKKIEGRKRHILVDTLGLLLNVVVQPDDVQDRDGAVHLLR
jgi:transposase